MKKALDLDFDLLADSGVAVVNDDHGTVGQVTDALAFVFAFAHDSEVQNFARQKDDTHGLGHFVEVDVVDALEFGEFAEVVIVGEKFCAQVAREADEFAVHFSLIREVAVVNFDFIGGAFLDTAEYFETAASTSALNGVLGVGDLLEFFQDKARDDDDAFEEIGFDEVGDAAIDDDTGIEQEKIVGFILFCEPNVRDDEREIFLVAAHGKDDADVTEAQEEAEANEPAGGFVRFEFEETGAVDEQGDDAAQKQAEGGGGECAKGKALEHFIDGDHDPAKAEADNHANQGAIICNDELGAHLANRVASDRAHRQKQDANYPEGHRKEWGYGLMDRWNNGNVQTRSRRHVLNPTEPCCVISLFMAVFLGAGLFRGFMLPQDTP